MPFSTADSSIQLLLDTTYTLQQIESRLRVAAGICDLLRLVVGVLVWATVTPLDRARRWHRAGIRQTRIAHRLGVTR